MCFYEAFAPTVTSLRRGGDLKAVKKRERERGERETEREREREREARTFMKSQMFLVNVLFLCESFVLRCLYLAPI